jgi:AcrR family transcriptional regulator
VTETGWRADPSTEAYDRVRERLIDAAERWVERNGLTRVRVDEIADEADCSRATIYRYFADKDELVRELLIRRARGIADQLNDQLDLTGDPATAFVRGVLAGVEAVRADPYFESFWGPDAQPQTTRLVGGSTALNQLIARGLEPLLMSALSAGRLRPGVTPSEAAEWTFMVTLALLVVPSPVERTSAEREEFLHTFLVPALFC